MKLPHECNIWSHYKFIVRNGKYQGLESEIFSPPPRPSFLCCPLSQDYPSLPHKKQNVYISVRSYFISLEEVVPVYQQIDIPSPHHSSPLPAFKISYLEPKVCV